MAIQFYTSLTVQKVEDLKRLLDKLDLEYIQYTQSKVVDYMNGKPILTKQDFKVDLSKYELNEFVKSIPANQLKHNTDYLDGISQTRDIKKKYILVGESDFEYEMNDIITRLLQYLEAKRVSYYNTYLQIINGLGEVNV